MLDTTPDVEKAAESAADPLSQLTPAESPGLPPTGVHPVVIKVVLSAAAWFIAVTWLNFAGGIEVDFDLALVTGFFVMFFTLFLLTASLVIKDPRWKQRNTSFTEFLKDQVAIDTYTMRGSDVLIHISMLPVTLAAGATVLGLIWSIVRSGS